MANMSGIFSAATDQVRALQQWVQDRQTEASDQADSFRLAAQESIDGMAAFIPGLSPNATPPEAPQLDLNIDTTIDLPDLGSDSFGSITTPNRADIAVTGVSPVPPVVIEDFNLNLESINIPVAPEERYLGEVPTKPVLGEIALPDKPELNKPGLPSLTNIVIPDFAFPTLPEFTAESPVFVGSSVSTVLQWQETPYEPTILPEVMEKLRGMWSGQLGLPPAVEQALWERAQSREDMGTLREVSAAALEFSSRGYTLPPGAMVSRLDAIREEGQLRKQALAREVVLKIADTQIENLRFACTQALASEEILLRVWTAMAEREFQAAKIQLDQQMALLNVQVAIFNAKQSAYQTEATVYRAKLDGKLAQLQVYRMQLDGEIAKGQINEQKVRIYSEQIKALSVEIDVYRAEMEGAKVQSDVQKNQIDAFGAEVRAFAEVINADKVRFDVYKVQVDGEAAKANMLESRSRAYAAYVSGQNTKAEVGFRNQQAQLAVQEQRVRAYMANLDKDRAIIAAQSAVVQANADAHRANTARYTASAGVQTERVRLQVQASETEMRTAIAFYEVQIRRFTADMEQLIRAASLQLEALKAAGAASSTLAAGAMAGISVSAQVGADARISANGNEQINITVPAAPIVL